MKFFFHIRSWNLMAVGRRMISIRWKFIFMTCDNFNFYGLQHWHTLYSFELSCPNYLITIWKVVKTKMQQHQQPTPTSAIVKRLTIYSIHWMESPYHFYLLTCTQYALELNHFAKRNTNAHSANVWKQRTTELAFYTWTKHTGCVRTMRWTKKKWAKWNVPSY